MIEAIDTYKLCLYCKCLNCKKETITKEPYSCSIYPERRGIPPKIWNNKDEVCDYFEPKK